MTEYLYNESSPGPATYKTAFLNHRRSPSYSISCAKRLAARNFGIIFPGPGAYNTTSETEVL